jgi:DNA-binding NarL/FixJ family response regulator
MNVNKELNVNIVITDKPLRDAVKAQLAECYKAGFFVSIDACLAANNRDTVDLLLCEYIILADQQAQLLSQLRAAYPNTRILIIGPHCDSVSQIAVLKQGARGYFDCTAAIDKLNDALRCVALGEVWIERHIVSGLIDELSHTPKISEEQQQAIDSLSRKERQVAELVSHGATNKMIANKMDITERTVKSHLTTIFQKLGLSDRLSLAIFFRDLR